MYQDILKLALPRIGTHTDAPLESTGPRVSALVDDLGALHAVIADLQDQADKIRTELEETGLRAIEGVMYRATFAQVQGSTRVDWKAVAAKLKPSYQLIAAHTSISAASTRLTVRARKIN